MNTEIIPATQEHALYIAENMRKADREEVMASHGHTPKQAVMRSLNVSDKSWACTLDGEPVCIWGVATIGSILSFTGAPWLLGTDKVNDIKFYFLRNSANYVDEMHKNYDLLENYVDERNTLSKAWLKWLGFKIDKAEPHGVAGLPFHRFYMGK
ncbi:MAG: hypothetical protein CL561_00350 [Alphaproteobacteria bacterium]|nr:hypothetical protein [Alphaproteobacteria bacterium]|tara:strand:+ start:12461 stop:12922 length:462 start_codon:yes stop_codon:yes gene_type:complete